MVFPPSNALVSILLSLLSPHLEIGAKSCFGNKHLFPGFFYFAMPSVEFLQCDIFKEVSSMSSSLAGYATIFLSFTAWILLLMLTVVLKEAHSFLHHRSFHSVQNHLTTFCKTRLAKWESCCHFFHCHFRASKTQDQIYFCISIMWPPLRRNAKLPICRLQQFQSDACHFTYK